jgi:hypothetical protein
VIREQQYKNKLSEWGFVKKMPKDGVPKEVIEFVLGKMEERELEGKKTEFVWGNRILPIDRVQQQAKRERSRGGVTMFNRMSMQFSLEVTLD